MNELGELNFGSTNESLIESYARCSPFASLGALEGVKKKIIALAVNLFGSYGISPIPALLCLVFSPRNINNNATYNN